MNAAGLSWIVTGKLLRERKTAPLGREKPVRSATTVNHKSLVVAKTKAFPVGEVRELLKQPRLPIDAYDNTTGKEISLPQRIWLFLARLIQIMKVVGQRDIDRMLQEQHKVAAATDESTIAGVAERDRIIEEERIKRYKATGL